jgi:thioredoxin 1
MQIIHFTAEWCAPCKKIKPIVESFIENNTHIKYMQIDVDQNLEFAKKYGVLSVPTLLFVDEENQFANKRHVGLITIEQLKEYTN